MKAPYARKVRRGGESLAFLMWDDFHALGFPSLY